MKFYIQVNYVMAECALGSAMNLWVDGCAFKLGPLKNKNVTLTV